MSNKNRNYSLADFYIKFVISNLTLDALRYYVLSGRIEDNNEV